MRKPIVAISGTKLGSGSSFCGPDGEEIVVRNHLAGTAAVVVRDGAGNPLRTYMRYATGSWAWVRDDINVGRLAVAYVKPSGVMYVHSDHLGSPRRVTDESGSVIGSTDFYPFGLPVPGSSMHGRWFAGYELEHQNTATTYTDDLYFLHARWYVPLLARFTAHDTMRGTPTSPQSFNLFTYVRNNPLMLTDPWGREAAPGAASPCSYPEGDEACENAAKNAAQTESDQPAKETTSLLPRFYERVEVRASALDVETRLWVLGRELAASAPGNAWVSSNSDATMAVLRALQGQLHPGPGPCRSMTFGEKFWLNMKATNASVLGIPLLGPRAVSGAGFFGSRFVKEVSDLPTAADWARARFRGVTVRGVRHTALESGILAATNFVAGRILVLPGFELGAAVGSAYQAATETCGYFEGLR